MRSYVLFVFFWKKSYSAADLIVDTLNIMSPSKGFQFYGVVELLFFLNLTILNTEH